LSIAEKLMDSGFSSAIIQKQDAKKIHYSSTFYVEIIIGVIIAFLLWISAPLIASFFNEEVLIQLTRFFAFKFIITPFGIIQMNLLNKELKFNLRAKVMLISSVLSGIIAVIMAYSGFGVWSLAVKMLSNALFRTVLLWIYVDWRPGLHFSLKAVKELFDFGSKLLIASLFSAAFKNIYRVVIGRLYAPAILGFYEQATKVERIPTTNFTGIITRVVFPAFSKLQDDVDYLKRSLKKAVKFMSFINFPMMIGLMIIAKPLVITVFTDTWAPMIPYLQLLCFTGLLYPLHAVNLNLVKAVGRSDLYLKINVLKKVLNFFSIIIFYRFGVEGLLFGKIIVSFLAYIVNTMYTSHFANYGLKEQIIDFIPAIGLTGVMAVLVYSIKFAGISSSFLLLVTQVASGVIIYFGLAAIFKLEIFLETWDIVWERIVLILKSKGLMGDNV